MEDKAGVRDTKHARKVDRKIQSELSRAWELGMGAEERKVEEEDEEEEEEGKITVAKCEVC